jgi:hypothetical protein
MAPVWNALPDEMKGKFYLPHVLLPYAKKQITNIESIQALNCRSDKPTSCVEIPFSRNVVVTSAYGDMQLAAHYNERPLILMEHGVGLTFNQPNGRTVSGYGGGEGYRANVSLFLAPNEYIAAKTRATFPDAPQVVIGTPKLDPWAEAFGRKGKAPEHPIVVIAFHWDGSAVAPEAGNAWEYYRKILPDLKGNCKFTLMGHAHPKIFEKLEFQYHRMNIPVVKNFAEVMRIADVYVNDCSSTMYEFCVTGKPVVVMNAPWFRRWFNHGIRFWDYSDVGPVCDKPNDLEKCIFEALEDPAYMRARRRKYIKELYPNLGTSVQTAVNALKEFCYD